MVPRWTSGHTKVVAGARHLPFGKGVIMQSTLQLGIIGNCQVAALIDPEASIVWCCLPRLDGDPVFSSLLTSAGSDAAQGVFRIELAQLRETQQRYISNTAVLETVLTDASGNSVMVTDFCPRFRRHGRIFRPMSLVRIIQPMNGRPLLTLRLRPTAHYGEPASSGTSGSHHLRFSSSSVDYRITTNASLTAINEERSIVLDHPIA